MLATATQNTGVGGPGLCETCHVEPKFFDSGSNKLHPYCGKTCAAKANKQVVPAPGVGLCVICQSKPRYVEGARIHPYCGKTCAAKANQGNSQQLSTNSNANSNACQIPGCAKPRWNDSKYCGRTHKLLAKTACLMCRAAPKQDRSHFCGKSCADDAQNMAVTLLKVPKDHVTFRSVANQFETSWRHGSRCPDVKHVYKIVSQQSSVDKYEAYKKVVERKGHFVAQGRHAGNENRRWHGTTRRCTLGEKGNIQFCSSPLCSLCCIIQTSFDVAKWGKKFSYGRFGQGIYVSSTSSKSHDYITSSNSNASLKAMLLNKVIVGKGCKKTMDHPWLTAPPSGYDSVLAETGLILNYDECVVYNNDAIRPSFLVMYD